jgi:hypothetical protein
VRYCFFSKFCTYLSKKKVVSLLNKTAFLLDELRIIVASVSDTRF